MDRHGVRLRAAGRRAGAEPRRREFRTQARGRRLIGPASIRHKPPWQRPAATPHILVVEDDREISALVARYLRANECRVSLAGDGREMDRVLADAAGSTW